jgi:heme A synthase
MRGEFMSKSLALFFAALGVLIMIGIGAALSYRELGIALILLAVYIAVVGLGFVVKARLRRKNE